MIKFQIQRKHNNSPSFAYLSLIDPDLSWGAKGLHAHLVFSTNNHEEILNINDNSAGCMLGVLFDELEKFGYVEGINCERNVDNKVYILCDKTAHFMEAIKNKKWMQEDIVLNFFSLCESDFKIADQLTKNQIDSIKQIAKKFECIFDSEILEQEIEYCLLDKNYSIYCGESFFQKLHAIMNAVVIWGDWKTPAGKNLEQIFSNAVKLNIKS